VSAPIPASLRVHDSLLLAIQDMYYIHSSLIINYNGPEDWPHTALSKPGIITSVIRSSRRNENIAHLGRIQTHRSQISHHPAHTLRDLSQKSVRSHKNCDTPSRLTGLRHHRGSLLSPSTCICIRNGYLGIRDDQVRRCIEPIVCGIERLDGF